MYHPTNRQKNTLFTQEQINSVLNHQNSIFINSEQLKEAFGAKRTTNLKQLLSKNKVTFFIDINGKPFTTPKALNAALGVGAVQTTNDDGFNIEHLK